ncbi:MAG: tetratricopeptide repeat protein [Aestuariivirga sp.]
MTAIENLCLKEIIQMAAFGLLLAGCQPSAENRLLQGSGMTLEDPKFYPSDEYIRMAKVNFRNGDYGLAESNYRKAVEVTPKDAEAWLGLAASYDQLRRFDLADNAYQKVLQLEAKNAAILNNAGYSQLLRGDLKNARIFLLKAYELEPSNPYIVNNIALLGESGKSVKRTDL